MSAERIQDAALRLEKSGMALRAVGVRRMLQCDRARKLCTAYAQRLEAVAAEAELSARTVEQAAKDTDKELTAMGV